MISLKNILNEAESFTAINKDSGKVSVFKSKEARDSAIKQGTHDAKDDKAAKGGDSSAGDEKPKVNIFNKDKETPSKDSPKKAKFKDFKVDVHSAMKDIGFSSADLGGMEGTEDYEGPNDSYLQISKGKLFDDPNEFAVFGGFWEDSTDASADNNYKSFNSKEDAVAYAKELGQKLKGGKEEPKSEPAKDSTGDRAGNLEVNKTVRAKAKKLGITPAKLGKDEYKLKMSQAAVEALTDANFHSEARALIAKLEGKPEWAEKPTDMPDISSPEYDEWRKTSVYSSKYYDADDTVMSLGTTASQESSWDGRDALDSIAFDLKMNGFKDLASTLQSVIKENKSTKLGNLI